MASPEYEQLRKVLKPGLAIPSDPPELVREKMHRIHPTKYPDDVKVERTTLGGVDAAWVGTPESVGSTRVQSISGASTSAHGSTDPSNHDCSVGVSLGSASWSQTGCPAAIVVLRALV